MANGKEQRGIATQEKERTRLPAIWPDDIDRFMDRFFNHPMRGFWRMRPPMATQGEWLPDMDVLEQEGNIVMRMDLPGMKREDIDVAIEGEMLVVRGQRKEEKETKEEDYYCAERATGSFYRSMRLPEGSNPDAIEATYKDGVLEIRAPRPETPEPKKLKVAVK